MKKQNKSNFNQGQFELSNINEFNNESGINLALEDNLYDNFQNNTMTNDSIKYKEDYNTNKIKNNKYTKEDFLTIGKKNKKNVDIVQPLIDGQKSFCPKFLNDSVIVAYLHLTL